MRRITLALLMGLTLGGQALAQNPYAGSFGGSSSLVIGTTPITGGATTQVLFNNGGVIGSDAGFTKASGATGTVTMGGNLATGTAGSNNTITIAQTSGVVTLQGDGTNLVLRNTGTQGLFIDSFGSGVTTFRSNGGSNTQLTLSLGGNGTFLGTISASLASATGTNAVCNTPGTSTALTVQVWATGCAASSARFKEGIASISREKALEDVLHFDAVSYRYHPDSKLDDGVTHVGFTAEQIGAVDPQWITYEDDGVTPHAVKYNEMIPLLAAAIQALDARLKSIEGR